MGHHINKEGQFQSDRFPGLSPDKIVVSFKSRYAHPALAALAESYETLDPDLSEDIRERLQTIKRS